MSDALAGVRLKRSRAWDQINGLNADLVRFLGKEPYSPRANFDSNTSELTVSIHITKTPDPLWGVRVGEIVHNLRSALDHLVWQLVILNRKTPTAKDKNQFPIFDTRGGFDNLGAPKHLKNVARVAIDAILAEQPFPKTDGGTGEGTKSPLWHLQELSNIDKHRTLHLTGTILKEFKMETAPLKFAVKTFTRERNPIGPIQQDYVLERTMFVHAKTGQPVREWPFRTKDIKGHLAADVAFEEGTPAVGAWVVSATLVDVANRVDRILGTVAKDIFRIDL